MLDGVALVLDFGSLDRISIDDPMKVRVPAEQTILIHTCGYKADIWKKHLIFGLPERASCARFIEEVNE